MRMFKAFWMSFSMFCALPTPVRVWDDTLRPLMTALIGVVGLLIGCLWMGIALLCQSMPPLLCAAFITITPWFASGFIHLDGFMDCADAMLSRRDLAQRRRILKDSSCGAFSVIAFVCLALVCFGAVASSTWSAPWCLIWIAMVPRCASGIAVLTLPPMDSSQYAVLQPSKGVLFTAWTVLVLALGSAALCGTAPLVCAVASLVGWLGACLGGYRNLQGMSGDISGYAITLGEGCGLLALALI